MVHPATSELELTTVDHATTAGACGLIAAPWITVLNPYLTGIGVLFGIAWVGVQMYYKIKHERNKR